MWTDKTCYLRKKTKTKTKTHNDMHVPILLHSKGARLKRNKHKKVSFDLRIIIF